ncbi:HAD-like domain-containing protein [Delphinella strobiligena]|nr:HAD-like domain-containing protein [Delphinella strobiligena]
MSNRPKVVLFDIGGVCVVSPFQAILDYEKKKNIPLGWTNHAISASSPHGSWQKLERGEIPLDNTFFRHFHADLTDEKTWKRYHLEQAAKKDPASLAVEETIFNAPPLPTVDAEWLYWEMMRISRSPDPHMFPALRRLRLQADKSRDGDAAFLIGALSNTSIFPADHEFSRQDTPEGIFNLELKALFDVFVSSAHVGMRKPDVDIYEHAIERLDELARKRGIFGGEGVKAGDIVFLDDIGGNLRTARKVGMRTIKVGLGRADLAVKELEKAMGLRLSSLSSKL